MEIFGDQFTLSVGLLDNVLDRVTGSDPMVMDYVLEVPASCPELQTDILEKTLVEAF